LALDVLFLMKMLSTTVALLDQPIASLPAPSGDTLPSIVTVVGLQMDWSPSHAVARLPHRNDAGVHSSDGIGSARRHARMEAGFMAQTGY
jgi:hypothetical protein